MTMYRRLLIACLFGVACVAGGAEPADGKPPQTGVEFDGKTAYAVPVEALALNPKALTVAGWVNLAGVNDSQVFLNVGKANAGFTFYLYNQNVRMLVAHKASAYAYALASPPSPGAWVHYAGSYDGQSIRVYMNGRLVKTASAPGQMKGAAGKLYIGSVDEHERFLRGRMDDLRIWRRTLTDEEIRAVASGESPEGIDRDLAARWTSANLDRGAWKTQPASVPAAVRVERTEPKVLINAKDDGYRGIWYMNQPSGDEYVYKYSGGLGTYCANHSPFAWYVPEVKKTFFVYGGTTKDSMTRLVHMVSYYDHQTGAVPRPTLLLDKRTDDAHDNPVINVDDKGFIWVFSSSHGQSRPSYISRSRKPYNVDEFERVWTGNFSYPQPWHFPGQGFLLMHTFYSGGRTICMMTSPDGAQWSERRLLSSIAQGHYQVSRPAPDGRIGTSFMYHPKVKGLNWRTNLYYMESADFGKTWKSVAGEELKMPLTEIVNPALVQEYESKGLLVYIQDLNYDTAGRPVILYTTSKGYESGPKNMPRTWTIAHWTGSSWEIHGGDIISDNNYDTGSVYIESDHRWRIIGPTQQGPQAYNPGGEIAMWISENQGRNWKLVRQMTSGSDYNHTYVRRPVNAHPDFYGFWADGHGRKPSDSRLYFCNRDGEVFRLPVEMSSEFARPQRVTPTP